MTGIMMSPEEISLNERGPLLEAAQATVRKVVKWYRERAGYQADAAMRAAALDLDMSYWRARSLYYRDGVWAIAKAEHDRLMRRWGWHLDQRMAVVERIADEIRAERAQLPLDLDNNQPTGATWGSGGGTDGRRLRSGAASAR